MSAQQGVAVSPGDRVGAVAGEGAAVQLNPELGRDSGTGREEPQLLARGARTSHEEVRRGCGVHLLHQSCRPLACHDTVGVRLPGLFPVGDGGDVPTDQNVRGRGIHQAPSGRAVEPEWAIAIDGGRACERAGGRLSRGAATTGSLRRRDAGRRSERDDRRDQ